MLEKRKVYIDQLLRDLKALEERVSAIKDNDSLPFSFFRESFDKTQEISRTLHQLEFMQIDDMRREMERLRAFLIGVESREHRQVPPPTRFHRCLNPHQLKLQRLLNPRKKKLLRFINPHQGTTGWAAEEASPAPQPATGRLQRPLSLRQERTTGSRTRRGDSVGAE